MDAVVNRDDGPARNQGWQHVVCGVKERDAFAPEGERNPELFGDGIVARGFGDGPKVAPKRRKRRHVLGPAEHHEFRRLIDFRELTQQISDIGADAEIVQLSRVDADAHTS